MTETPIALELRAVSAGYHPASHDDVLRDIDLRLSPGEVVALIGANGAGKSTLLRTIGGVLHASRGQITLDGTPLRQLGPRARAQRIATVPQDGPIPPGLLVEEMVALGRTPYSRALLGLTRQDRDSIAWAMRATDVQPLAGRYVDELSGGERQRVILARALAQQPRVLLLDEPTANLDLHHQIAVLELVRDLSRARGLAVLAAVHDLQLAALYCDRLVLLRSGRVLRTGSPEEVLTARLIEDAFGQAVVLSRHPSHGVPLVALVPGASARRLAVGDLRSAATESDQHSSHVGVDGAHW